MSDDDDDEHFGGLFENGHWEWVDKEGGLVFVSDLPPVAIESIVIPLKAPTGAIEFKDDVDLLEQQRFRRRFQRKLKPGQEDIITLQDVKDIALFTAPIVIQSPMLINLLHTPTAERFLRALILYCQYYLQVATTMTTRMIELTVKLRQPESERIERKLEENLSDLRLLVSKEYSFLILGSADLKKFHHMGPTKKRRSLTDKDARLIETFIRISIQIVWLALDRKGFNQIELEVHRLFKSETFNMVEHTLKTGYIQAMCPEEYRTLMGRCVRNDKKLKAKSPLNNEVFCHSSDFRLTALGVLEMPKKSTRLRFLEAAVSGPEESLQTDQGFTLGIIGMHRAAFDTMLHPIKQQQTDASKSKSTGGFSKASLSKSSTGSSKKSSGSIRKVYDDILIPDHETVDFLPPIFPSEPPVLVTRMPSETQRRVWLNRLIKLMKALNNRRTSASVNK